MIKLLPHQEEVFEKTKNHNRVGYFLDMGLGKTFLGSFKAVSMGVQILCVCQKSKVHDWVEHFEEFYPHLSVSDLTGRKKNYNADVLVINYDIVWRREELKDLDHFTLLLDESSHVKNPKSNRTRIFCGNKRPKVIPLKFKNVILLSGTPTGGKYEELVTQCNLLGWNISNDTYWEHYVKSIMMDLGPNQWGGRIQIPKATGYKNVNRLKRKLKDHGAVFMKTEEVMTLPSQNDITINVPQIKEYGRFLKDRVIDIDGKTLMGDSGLNKMLYARQLCSLYSKHKLKSFEDLLESTEDRLIVFYNWTHECDTMVKLCKKLKKPVSVVNGKKKDLKNYESKSNSVTLIQYQAGAMGLNLQLSNKIVYYSLPLSSELFEQSKKRTHRIGQERPCFYYYMLTEESIEHDIMETLKKREDYNAELFR